MTTPQTETQTVRAYWRCADCLSVYATDVPKPPAATDGRFFRGSLNVATDLHYLMRYAPICAVCNRETQAMGAVTGSGRVELTVERQECDAACQGAMGPTCDCKCLGANHGARWVAKTVVLETRETHPVVSMNDDQARERAAEYKAAKAAARAAINARYPDIDALLAKKAAGRWLESSEFNRMLSWRHEQAALNKASDLKTHKSRMARLAKLAQ